MTDYVCDAATAEALRSNKSLLDRNPTPWVRRYVIETLRPDVRLRHPNEHSATVAYRWRYLMSFDDLEFAKEMARAVEGRVIETRKEVPMK